MSGVQPHPAVQHELVFLRNRDIVSDQTAWPWACASRSSGRCMPGNRLRLLAARAAACTSRAEYKGKVRQGRKGRNESMCRLPPPPGCRQRNPFLTRAPAQHTRPAPAPSVASGASAPPLIPLTVLHPPAALAAAVRRPNVVRLESSDVRAVGCEWCQLHLSNGATHCKSSMQSGISG